MNRRAFFGVVSFLQPPVRPVITDTCLTCKVGKYETLGSLVTWQHDARYSMPTPSKTLVEQRCSSCGALRAVPKPSERSA